MIDDKPLDEDPISAVDPERTESTGASKVVTTRTRPFPDAIHIVGGQTEGSDYDADQDEGGAFQEQDDQDNHDGVFQDEDKRDEDVDETVPWRPLPNHKPVKFEIHIRAKPPEGHELYITLPPEILVKKVLGTSIVQGQFVYDVEFEGNVIEQVLHDELVGINGSMEVLEDYHNGQQEHDLSGGSRQAHLKRSRAVSEDEVDDSDLHSTEFDSNNRPKQRREQGTVRRSGRQRRKVSHPGSVDISDLSIVDEDRGLRSLDFFFDDPDSGSSKSKRSSKARKDLDNEKAPLRQTRRARNQNGGKKPDYRIPQLHSSDDELAGSGSADSQFEPAARNQGAKHGSKHSRPTFDEDSSSSEQEETRKSGRSGRNTKNMKDPEMDDAYDTVEDKATAAKHVSVREVFQPVDPDCDFAQMHSDLCDSCGNEGNKKSKSSLIFCQGCSYSYHKDCLGPRSQRDHRVTKVALDSFVLQCRTCIGTYQKRDQMAPDHAMCQTCEEKGPACSEFTPKMKPKHEEKLRQENQGVDPVIDINSTLINNPDNVLFRCSTCKVSHHFDHLPPLEEEVDTEMNDADMPNELRNKRLAEYADTCWRCKDCALAPADIDGLVAWRPAKPDSYADGMSIHDYSEDKKEYLVKWIDKSHFHDVWMPGAWVWGLTAPGMRIAFAKREENYYPKMNEADAIEEDWLLADVILDVQYNGRNPSKITKDDQLKRMFDIKAIRVKFQGLSYSENVWDGPPPQDSGAPWDAFCAAYEEYVIGQHFVNVSDSKMAERISQYRQLDFQKDCELKTQPSGLKKGKLMGYQMEGMNWLLYKYHQQQNVILADEMGLGKTIQVVAFLTALVQEQPNCWPFLIVVPNSTCANWRRELKNWVPEIRAVTYYGGKDAQDLAYDYELFPKGRKEGMHAHVVIMSFDSAQAIENRMNFRGVKWAGLVIDEGQRLKNEKSLLYQALRGMHIPFRILLTGTPLQNNKRELFNLLQFIDPGNDANALDEQYREITKENLPTLHALIRPYFLRRTKLQVLKFLPPMSQIILPVSMTVVQERICRSIIARNPDLIRAIVSIDSVKTRERKGLNNILMDLRQCLCHPFVFSGDVEEKLNDDETLVEQNLIEASGKLLLLRIMLPKLRERGHRVLIFSQFLHSLTILEDFLSMMGLVYARIDGSMSALKKQKCIDAFNAPNSALFAMLLSTRAGGVGINLATADTVIIYDPDHNPHQDIQALSRAHRIGQQNKVLCFQLMTKHTVEEKIMQIGRKKMALDHALIESMDADEDIGDDIVSTLKHGAEALFDGHDRIKITYDDASVEKLIDRSQIELTNTASSESSADNQFSFARVWANDDSELADVDMEPDEDPKPIDPSVWENILKEREEEHQRKLALEKKEYGRGTRRRGKEISYAVRMTFEDDKDDSVQSAAQGEVEEDANDSAIEEDSEEDEAYVDKNEPEGSDSEPTGNQGPQALPVSAPAPAATPAPVPDKLHLISKPSTLTVAAPSPMITSTPTAPIVSVPQQQSVQAQPSSNAAPGVAAKPAERPKIAITRPPVVGLPGVNNRTLPMGQRPAQVQGQIPSFNPQQFPTPMSAVPQTNNPINTPTVPHTIQPLLNMGQMYPNPDLSNEELIGLQQFSRNPGYMNPQNQNMIQQQQFPGGVRSVPVGNSMANVATQNTVQQYQNGIYQHQNPGPVRSMPQMSNVTNVATQNMAQPYPNQIHPHQYHPPIESVPWANNAVNTTKSPAHGAAIKTIQHGANQQRPGLIQRPRCYPPNIGYPRMTGPDFPTPPQPFQAFHQRQLQSNPANQSAQGLQNHGFPAHILQAQVPRVQGFQIQNFQAPDFQAHVPRIQVLQIQGSPAYGFQAHVPQTQGSQTQNSNAQAPRAQGPRAQGLPAQGPPAQIPQAQAARVQVPHARVPRAPVPHAQISQAQISQAQDPRVQVPSAQGPLAQGSPSQGFQVNQPTVSRPSRGCLVCGLRHSNLTCVDMNSSISLRMALESLEDSNGDPELVESATGLLKSKLDGL